MKNYVPWYWVSKLFSTEFGGGFHFMKKVWFKIRAWPRFPIWEAKKGKPRSSGREKSSSWWWFLKSIRNSGQRLDFQNTRPPKFLKVHKNSYWVSRKTKTDRNNFQVAKTSLELLLRSFQIKALDSCFSYLVSELFLFSRPKYLNSKHGPL